MIVREHDSLRAERYLRLAAAMREAVTWPIYSQTYKIDYTKLPACHFGKCRQPVWEGWNEQFVRCRRCEGCDEHKRRSWVARMVREAQHAERCWFVTLTYRDQSAFGYASVQQWLKRVRKASPPGAVLRFVCTDEAGSQTGRLHHHLLVYGNVSLRWRDLCQTWKEGFSSAKLVRSALGAARYCAKYITKSAGRIRASCGFGSGGRLARGEGEASQHEAAPHHCALSPSATATRKEGERDESTKGTTRGGEQRDGVPPPPPQRTYSGRWHVDPLGLTTELILRQWTGYHPVCIALWFHGEGPC